MQQIAGGGEGGGCRLDLGGGNAMVVLCCRKLPQLWEIFLFLRETNEPVMAIRAQLFTTNYTNRVVHVFTLFPT